MAFDKKTKTGGTRPNETAHYPTAKTRSSVNI